MREKLDYVVYFDSEKLSGLAKRGFQGRNALASHPIERARKGEREKEMVHVNGKKVGGNANICKFTAYVSPYFVVSNGGAYPKHIYAVSQRIASKLGNIDGFGADPRRVEQAGGRRLFPIRIPTKIGKFQPVLEILLEYTLFPSFLVSESQHIRGFLAHLT